MAINGGDVIARVLKSRGVFCVFTLCGGHIAPILVGCRQAGIRVVDVRGEAAAVFAAEATARLTGVPGVAVVTAGPGVTNTVTAVKNAQLAQVPLVLIGGAAATVLKGRGSLQDIDQLALLKPIVKMAVSVTQNCDLVPVLEDAFEVAAAGVPGPVFVECPIDLLYDEALVREWYVAGAQGGKGGSLQQTAKHLYLKYHVNRMFACNLESMVPSGQKTGVQEQAPVGVDRALRLLGRAAAPVLVVGSQALLSPRAAERLAADVEALGIPVFLAGMARGLLGAGHRLHMRHRRREALKHADLVVLAGMPCDFRLDYGRVINPQAALVAVNRSRRDLTLNRKPTLAVHGDPALFLERLASDPKRPDPSAWEAWHARLTAADQDRELEMSAMSAEPPQGVDPLVFFRRLNAFLGPRSLLVADGGDFVATAAYTLEPQGPLRWLDPGVFGTLGVGGGFALGAKLARPESEVWLLYGDGSAGYSLQEFDTFVRHGVPLIAVVGNDAGWTQIARDQVALFKDDVATVLRRTDYHTVARGFGGEGLLLARSDRIDATLRKARRLAALGKPVLINLILAPTDFRKGSLSV